MPGRRVEKRLSAAQVKSLQTSGKYEDGGGLRLIVGDTRAKRWVLRVSINGQRIERGLGSYPAVSLEEARIKAGEVRKVAKTGIDMRDEARRRTSSRTTFRHMFEISFAQRERQLSNRKHLRQWPATMEAYVFPKIGNVPVAEVTAAQVLDVLTPIWFEKPETAKRVLQRMETVFKSAIVRGIRERASPCVSVAKELGTKHRQVKHHASMSWKDALPGQDRQVIKRAFNIYLNAASNQSAVHALSGELRDQGYPTLIKRLAELLTPSPKPFLNSQAIGAKALVCSCNGTTPRFAQSCSAECVSETSRSFLSMTASSLRRDTPIPWSRSQSRSSRSTATRCA